MSLTFKPNPNIPSTFVPSLLPPTPEKNQKRKENNPIEG